MVKHIHAIDKMELADLIVKCAPPNAKKFQIVQKLPPGGYLVEYDPTLGGDSIHELAVELGLEAKIAPKARNLIRRYSPSIGTQIACRIGHTGFVLLGSNMLPLVELEDKRYERKLQTIRDSWGR